MLNLSDWSFARVVLVGAAWIALAVGWQVLQFYLLFRRMRAESGGIGAVSIGLFGIVPVLFGPPILLLVVWLVLRYVHRT
jgi:hypothetical protein